LRSFDAEVELIICVAYTTFAFSNLTIEGEGIKKREADKEMEEMQRPRISRQDYLFSYAGHNISVIVTNTGKVAGAEVAQLYLQFSDVAGVEFPVQQLRGFQKVFLQAGESKMVSFRLRHRDISYWDVGKQDWVHAKGQAKVKVANSALAEGVIRTILIQ
jgi:beta-glucosidase